MPLIAWLLVAYFALSGGMALASIFAKEAKEPEFTAATATASILVAGALYGWLVWAVVRLATT